ncbi:MAG: class I tRNA ligase family protein, partial [Microgenomates group bacterium]
LSAGVALPKSISVHGYITADGQKMSKSLGNVIDPFALIETYSLEHIRYYLLKEIPTHSDGDFSEDKFKELYTADLANGLGNLCSRVAKLCEKADVSIPDSAIELDSHFKELFEAHEISLAGTWLSEQVRSTDLYLSTEIPWKKSGSEQAVILQNAVHKIRSIVFHLSPFMPKTAQFLQDHFSAKKYPHSTLSFHDTNDN